MMFDNKTFVKLMNWSGLTQVQTGELMGVSKSCISHYVAGRRECTPRMITALKHSYSQVWFAMLKGFPDTKCGYHWFKPYTALETDPAALFWADYATGQVINCVDGKESHKTNFDGKWSGPVQMPR